MVAKSAIFASMLTTAAHPPLFSSSERRSSLNQTSPQRSLLVGFFTPNIMVRTFPKLGFPRSEEHTSELQSRPHLVCRLLLEKKKKKKKNKNNKKKKNQQQKKKRNKHKKKTKNTKT